MSAPPTNAANQTNDPFGFLGNLSAPPTSSSQSHDLFGLTPAPDQFSSITTMQPAVTIVPSVPSALPNLNDMFVPLETITPGN